MKEGPRPEGLPRRPLKPRARRGGHSPNAYVLDKPRLPRHVMSASRSRGPRLRHPQSRLFTASSPTAWATLLEVSDNRAHGESPPLAKTGAAAQVDKPWFFFRRGAHDGVSPTLDNVTAPEIRWDLHYHRYWSLSPSRALWPADLPSGHDGTPKGARTVYEVVIHGA